MTALTKARDRAHPRRARHLAEQPDRHGRPPRRARGPARSRVPPRRSSCSTRPTTSTSPASTLPGPWSCCRRYPNLAVLRTFSKAYGLASLRVGYLLGPPAGDQRRRPGARPVRRERPGPGGRAGVAGARRRAARAGHRHAGRAGAGASALCGASASRPPTPQANFVWLPAGAAAAALTLKLETIGVVTRPFPDEGVRVTIGSPAENDQLPRRLRERAPRPLELSAHWGLPTGHRAAAVQDWVDRIDAADARLVAHATHAAPGPHRPRPGRHRAVGRRPGVGPPRRDRGLLAGRAGAASSTPPAPSPSPSAG